MGSNPEVIKGHRKPRASTACEETILGTQAGTSHQVRLHSSSHRETEKQARYQTFTPHLEYRAGLLTGISLTTPCVSTQK